MSYCTRNPTPCMLFIYRAYTLVMLYPNTSLDIINFIPIKRLLRKLPAIKIKFEHKHSIHVEVIKGIRPVTKSAISIFEATQHYLNHLKIKIPNLKLYTFKFYKTNFLIVSKSIQTVPL
jgi:hypothetical protein